MDNKVGMKYHQALCPVSCSRRTVTAIIGINVTNPPMQVKELRSMLKR